MISRTTLISLFILRPPKHILQDTSRKIVFRPSQALNPILFHYLPRHPPLSLLLVRPQLPRLHLKKTLQLGFDASMRLAMNSRNSGTCSRKNSRHAIRFSGGYKPSSYPLDFYRCAHHGNRSHSVIAGLLHFPPSVAIEGRRCCSGLIQRRKSHLGLNLK